MSCQTLLSWQRQFIDDCSEGCRVCGQYSNSHRTMPHTSVANSGKGLCLGWGTNPFSTASRDKANRILDSRYMLIWRRVKNDDRQLGFYQSSFFISLFCQCGLCMYSLASTFKSFPTRGHTFACHLGRLRYTKQEMLNEACKQCGFYELINYMLAGQNITLSYFCIETYREKKELKVQICSDVDVAITVTL